MLSNEKRLEQALRNRQQQGQQPGNLILDDAFGSGSKYGALNHIYIYIVQKGRKAGLYTKAV